MGLFLDEPFTSHSGKTLDWKIECDSLPDSDLETIAALIARRYTWSRVVGIPTGGLRLATKLEKYTIRVGSSLIVDDVCTTGKSFEEARVGLGLAVYEVFGITLFARCIPPNWVIPVFQLTSTFQDYGR